MKALVYHGPFDLRVEERPRPRALGPDDVVVRVRRTGICGTDIGIATGKYSAKPGVVLGHESVGEVAETGPGVTDLPVGTQVVVNPTFFCGSCAPCRSGRENHCARKHETEAGVSADGLFAEYYLTSRTFVHPLPAGTDRAGMVLSEPLSCALTGVRRLRLTPQLRAAVLGGGPMGVMYASLLAQQGLTGVLVEASAARAEVLRTTLPGLWPVVENLPEAVDRLARPGSGLDVVVDTTGVLLEQALPLLNPGGQLLLVGLSGGSATIDPAWIADNSIQVLGSIDSLGTFGDAVELLAAGALPLDGAVTAEVPLEEFARAFALLGVDLAAGCRTEPTGHLKVCLTPASAGEEL
ncbi:zinc-binding dehydrogenase [Streptomyces sp. NK08204]|uniref:zinc-dependent alcohol dehydrogenase n=1 Tax=Streptomyces sp. NK08204 TaxID=2873260 RepID=UPI001CECA452|nr:alcohol dehydrogenase catalytic domain-containing protein [Streptomyces sp. NK08204]